MKKLRVLINPGHGYWQRPGKRSPWLGLDHPLKEKIMKMDGQKGPGWRLPEWATNKLIAEHICAAEYPDNLEVLNVMPDTERYGQFLSGRIAKGNKLKADLWIGVHSDADGSGNVFTNAGGHHVFYASARKEAEMLNKHMEMLFPNEKNRGTHNNPSSSYPIRYAELHQTNCSALISENFFFTNERECKLILDSIEVIGQAHINFLIEWSKL